jgi:arsenical pump membrane protein
MLFNSTIWAIGAAATLGVMARPWNLPEFVWAIAGAAMLVLFHLLPWKEAAAAVGEGADVYLFLIGMMLVSEVARKQGLFDWLAIRAVRHARGSAKRLFLMIYVVGTVVTALLSNDATAVVMTPAVYATTRAAQVEPLPYLFICAFVANAASFILPIANPANLVVFGEHMPGLWDWLRYFTGPSFAAILATYVALRLTQRTALDAKVATIEGAYPISFGGKAAAIGIALTVAMLLSASAFDWPLGLATFCAGASLTAIVPMIGRQSPLPILKDVSWGVLPLVAGLFVLVAGMNQTGVLSALAYNLHDAAATWPQATSWIAGVSVAAASNLVNNLPVGLIAGATDHAARVPAQVTGAMLIGIDLGPNLSVTGSLATVLWLFALRREGENVTSLRFLRLGLIVMPPALLVSLLALLATSP